MSVKRKPPSLGSPLPFQRRRKLLVPYMVLDLLGAVLFSIAVIAAMIVSEAKGETKAAVAFIGIAVVGKDHQVATELNS